MTKTPVEHLNSDSLRCAQCNQFWNACQCSTRKVIGLSDSPLVDIDRLSNSVHQEATLIADRYEVIEKLGEGGTGAVYLALHIVLKKKLAIKLLRKDLIEDLHLVERLRREAQACALLSHPNIISVFDFGVTGNGFPFIVMEYLEGRSLERVLKKTGKIEPGRLVKLAIQVCSGLQAAHEKAIIHRDLKPSNLLLSDSASGEETVKILDFGIAKADIPGGQHLTQTGDVIGSPAYMSPEQIHGKPIDGRSDIYSLGCVMYEMLTGVPLFRGETLMSTLQANLDGGPPALVPGKDDPANLENLYKIIVKCVEKEKEDRYDSIDLVKHDLAAVLPDATGQKRVSGIPHLVLIPSVAALFLLVLLAISLAWKTPIKSGSPNVSVKISDKQSDYVLDGRMLVYVDGFDDEATKCFRKALREEKSTNRRLFAASELMERLSSSYMSQLESGQQSALTGLAAEMESIMDQVRQLANKARTDKSISALYLAHCFYVYSYFLRQKADFIEKPLSSGEKLSASARHHLQLKVNDQLLGTVSLLQEAISIIELNKPLRNMSRQELCVLCSYNDYLAQNLGYVNKPKLELAARKRVIEIAKLLGGKDATNMLMENMNKLGDIYLAAGARNDAVDAFETAASYYVKADPGIARDIRRKILEVQARPASSSEKDLINRPD